MISFEKKFIFVHVPKTGGNSIQNILKKYSEDRVVKAAKKQNQDGYERFGIVNPKYGLVKHSTLSEYSKTLGTDIISDFFIFSTIRNPWDRLISLYFSSHRGEREWDREQFIKFIKKARGIAYFLGTPKGIKINRLIRFENLDTEFRNVCEKIGIPYEQLPHSNKSINTKHHFTSYYDSELIEIVRQNFSVEIGLGAYEFPENRS